MWLQGETRAAVAWRWTGVVWTQEPPPLLLLLVLVLVPWRLLGRFQAPLPLLLLPLPQPPWGALQGRGRRL
jgi:hypothetical protein